jgi:predicted nucleotidyltransferase
MSTTQRYREIAGLLTERLLAKLKDQIHSIVIFGSAARGDATENSDIDILVIMDAPFDSKQRIRAITYDLALDSGVIIQLKFFRSTGFADEALRFRSDFASDVIEQGIVLHDDGTFGRICQKVHPAGAGIPER